MNRFAFIIIFPILALAACATPHYSASVEMDRLTLRLKLPRAETVGFASSLDGFQVHEARRVDRRTWEVQKKALRPFKYFFIVDGAAYLPDCQLKEKDDFGSYNCLFLPEL